jgi:cytochrome c556
VWTNRADFDKRLKDFQAHAAALVQVNATEKGATDGFKAAVIALGEDCKGCHDTYKVK